jgi:hypothetical protein
VWIGKMMIKLLCLNNESVLLQFISFGYGYKEQQLHAI